MVSGGPQLGMATRQTDWEVQPVGSSDVTVEVDPGRGRPNRIRLTRDDETVTLHVAADDNVAEVVGAHDPSKWVRDAARRLGIPEVR